MAKLAFVVCVSMGTLFSLVSASLGKSGVHRRADTDVNSTVSSNSGACASYCALAEDVLSELCARFDFTVPCGCLNSYSIAQQACSRCRVAYAGSPSQMVLTAAHEQQSFGDFQDSCAASGLPIQGIDLQDIKPFIDQPIRTFRLEAPLSMDDSDFPNYVAMVCQRPELMTEAECFVGDTNWLRCPNPDVSGILVRLSAYMANLLLGIVLMFHPAEASTAFWTQLLTVYSLLISGLISIASQGMTRVHSRLLVFLVMSPLSTTIIVYAVLSLCGRPHRLASILSGRREHLLRLLLVIAFGLISLGILLFTNAAPDASFTPNPCEVPGFFRTMTGIMENLLFIPYAGAVPVLMVLFFGKPSASLTGGYILLLGPLIVVATSFLIALIRKRRLLSQQYKLQHDRWKIWVIWDVLAAEYPLLHFYAIFLVPILYWILANEIHIVDSPDNLFSTSFGQVLAVFVVLPPLLQVILMIPRAKPWALNLAVVRFFTRRPRAGPAVQAHSLEDGILEKGPMLLSPESSKIYSIQSLPLPSGGNTHRF
ncbi:hypothetical protein B0H15DRAFT_295009 [Mycena belliarum]|uniref:Uncharacterized protein n=1 Tax=Mycena belliarum TaxID=1033014 RepID=A0AAD6XQT0_9AGAR|nr:hypothetical protein B0H15DRAFT_295009 [Mycena belliae]